MQVDVVERHQVIDKMSALMVHVLDGGVEHLLEL